MSGFTRFSLSVAYLLIVSALGACGAPETPNNPDNPEPPNVLPTALVVGEAGSPFLTALRDSVRFVQDDGTQAVTDHDLLILDGDTYTPAELAEQAQVEEALDNGVWVLVADATAEHKQGIMPHLGFTTKGDTDAYLFRQVPGDMPAYDVLEMPPLPESEVVTQQVEAQAHQHRAFVDRLVAKFDSGASAQQTGGCASPLSIEPGIIFATWCYGHPLDWQIDSLELPEENSAVYAGDVIDGVSVQPQQGQNDPNFTFTLLLNNKDTVTGDFQTLHVEVDGQMTPTTTAPPYFMDKWSGGLQVAYPQSNLEISLEPFGSLLNPAANFEPQTPNNTETENYSSSTTFSIAATLNASYVPLAGGGGGGAGGGSVTGTYSTTSTNTRGYTVSDWTWTADLSGSNTYDWKFTSNNPPSGAFDDGAEWDGGWAQPNELSRNLMQYGAAAVWTTSGIFTDTLDFSVRSTQSLPNIFFIPGDVGFGNFLSGANELVAQVISIDLGAVVPVTLQEDSLTFTDEDGNPITEDNPVEAGEDVTATVKLSGPAPLTYNITATATSTNNNAAIAEKPVTVTKGMTTKTFTIETNDNDLDLRETVAVPISLGSFGSTATEQLWIQGPLFE